MVSFPDDLLARVDAHAQSIGATRSGMLQALAERELDAREATRSDVIDAAIRSAAPRGGDSVEQLRELRRAR
jgi:metal-responsive CopG/Arc/MetJ family transcriptional regulator